MQPDPLRSSKAEQNHDRVSDEGLEFRASGDPLQKKKVLTPKLVEERKLVKSKPLNP